MTLQDDLRMYAEDIHACYGHNDYSTTMSLAADRIDRIDELEKESNLLNVAWLQGEFSELQAKVEILLNEHAERGVRIDKLEATIRKMAMDSLSVEGQWSDKVDDLEQELEVWKKDSAVAWDLCDERRVDNSRVIQRLEACQTKINALEAELSAHKEWQETYKEVAGKELEAKQARIDELMMEHCPNEMTAEQMQNWEAHQVRESANQMLNGWKEDQECRNASS